MSVYIEEIIDFLKFNYISLLCLCNKWNLFKKENLMVHLKIQNRRIDNQAEIELYASVQLQLISHLCCSEAERVSCIYERERRGRGGMQTACASTRDLPHCTLPLHCSVPPLLLSLSHFSLFIFFIFYYFWSFWCFPFSLPALISSSHPFACSSPAFCPCAAC